MAKRKTTDLREMREGNSPKGITILTAKEYEKMGLIELLEHVNQLTEDSGLKADKLEEGKVLLDSAAARFNLSWEECVMLAIVIEESGTVEFDDMARHFLCSNLRVMTMKKFLDSLVDKRWLNFSEDFHTKGYIARDEALEALHRNEIYDCQEIKNLKAEDVLRIGYGLCQDMYHHNTSFQVFNAEIMALLRYNAEVPFVKVLRSYEIDDDETLMVMIMLCSLYKNNNTSMHINIVRRFFDSPRCHLDVMLEAETSNLFNNNLIEYECKDGVADKNSFQFTNSFRHKLTDGIKLCKKKGVQGDDIIPYGKVVAKSLFYNPVEEKQVKTLSKLLSTKQYREIVDRMKAKGFGSCFSCLFYGAPGTGKTETVLQLARMTGRDIVQVDMSELRDKFVGESEKNVKNIFSRYSQVKSQTEHTPILLLNEADAIIGKRMIGNLGSVDKMENAIQNIILQEMETFDGILIATTNLTDNIDSAFDRRFLYKIEFTKPSYEAKIGIWHSIMPEMSDDLTQRLAANFDLSGGQIQNVARKCTINSILYGGEPTFDDMRELCKHEIMQRGRNSQHIGFC